MAHQLGGHVEKGDKREYGHAEVEITGNSPLFAKMDSRQKVWMSHGDKVTKLPGGFRSLRAARIRRMRLLPIRHAAFSAIQFQLRGPPHAKREADHFKLRAWCLRLRVATGR